MLKMRGRLVKHCGTTTAHTKCWCCWMWRISISFSNPDNLIQNLSYFEGQTGKHPYTTLDALETLMHQNLMQEILSWNFCMLCAESWVPVCAKIKPLLQKAHVHIYWPRLCKTDRAFQGLGCSLLFEWLSELLDVPTKTQYHNKCVAHCSIALASCHETRPGPEVPTLFRPACRASLLLDSRLASVPKNLVTVIHRKIIMQPCALNSVATINHALNLAHAKLQN